MSGVKGAVYNVAINVKGLAEPTRGGTTLKETHALVGQLLEDVLITSGCGCSSRGFETPVERCHLRG